MKKSIPSNVKNMATSLWFLMTASRSIIGVCHLFNQIAVVG